MPDQRHHTPTRRTLLKGSLAIAGAPAIIGSARAQSKIVWKCQTHWPRTSSSFAGSAQAIARQLAERTDGRFIIEPLGAGELAKGPEVFSFVRRGIVPMGALSTSYVLDEGELMGLFGGIPGTLREPWQMTYFIKNFGVEDALNEELRASKGVFMRSDVAYPTELVLKKELKPGANLGAIKVRSHGNLMKYLGAAGFAAQFIPGSELYQALATGVMDGAHWGAAQGALSMKLWEVAPHHMKPPLVIANETYVINQAAYEKVPAELRAIFDALMEEHYYRRTNEYTHLEAVALKTGIEKMGVKVVEFPDDVQARFAEASSQILAQEMTKGPKAKAMGEKLLGLMKDLGYE